MPLLSVIIPVYNEEKTIAQVIQRVEAAHLPEGITREIIIINDGSTDGSKDALRPFESIHTVIHSANTGKGGAVRKGFAVAKGDYIIIQDADLEQDPNDFGSLMAPIQQGKVDVVFGSRFLGKYRPKAGIIMNLHYFLNNLYTWFCNFLTGYHTTDVWTGYKMYSRKALNALLPNLKSNGIEFELEVAIMLSKLGMKITDVSISYQPRWYNEGKKTDYKQAIRSACMMLGFRFRNVIKAN